MTTASTASTASRKARRDPGNPDWKGELQTLINEHNGQHSLREKVVSLNTRSARPHGLFRIFGWLRAGGYKLGPRSLRERHIQFLVGYLTADRSVEDGIRIRGGRLKMPVKPYSAAYIQQLLSFLRALCGWIGKPGMIRQASFYVTDPSLVRRSTNATRNRTWSGAKIDRQAIIDKVTRTDPVVGLQLEVLIAFGLRRKEAVMFSPTLAEVPVHALPAGASSGSHLAFIRVEKGTKGGRVRYTSIRNDEQRAVLARARLAAPQPGMHIGVPGRTLKQALNRFSNVLRRCGVCQSMLGVTTHGLRHEFAADLYYELTNTPAPIQGGSHDIDASVMSAAYLEVARQLGHGRARVTGAYLGGRGKAWLNSDIVATNEIEEQSK